MSEILSKKIRESEYPMLKGTTYLDHGGTTLYAKSLVDRFSQDMLQNLFGNPHSASPSSENSTKRVELARLRSLQFFKADPEHFDLVFTASATAAIKLVVEAFRDYAAGFADADTSGFFYGYHKDCHNSLVGIREVSSSSRCFASDDEVDLWLNGVTDARTVDEKHGLFSYPAQSNFNGHRCPLRWPGQLRRSKRPEHKNMYTLLDAAAYVPTCQLDLSNLEDAPDFTVLSFYKIFGFPDLGALIVRKGAAHMLRTRKYFGGGTVDMVIAIDEAWHAKKCEDIHSQLEDGTLPFHSIVALDSAMDVHMDLYGSMDAITQHTAILAKAMYAALSSLRHANGVSVCEIYKDKMSEYGDSKTQGATLAFNVRNSQGGWIGKSDFERLAISQNIQLRTGGVCNPGGIASSLQLASWELKRNFTDGLRCGNDMDIIGGKPAGVVRASLGAMSNIDDVFTLARFIQEFFLENAQDIAGIEPLYVAPPQTNGLLDVDRITIFPIVDCRGWNVPSTTSWEIRPEGLFLDREWAIVSRSSGLRLSPQEHPIMTDIETRVDLEQGILHVGIGERHLRPAHHIEISLWSTPGTNDTPPSTEVRDFFSKVIGVPCTFQRLPRKYQNDLSKWVAAVAFQQARPVKNPLRFIPMSSAGSITVHIVSSDCVKDERYPGSFPKPNVVLRQRSGAVEYPNTASVLGWHYLQIGSNYFQTRTLLVTPGRNAPLQHHIGKHLPSIHSGSPAAQCPTIKVGESAVAIPAFFSSGKQSYGPGSTKDLENCIASLQQAGFYQEVHGRQCWNNTEAYQGGNNLIELDVPHLYLEHLSHLQDMRKKDKKPRQGWFGTIKTASKISFRLRKRDYYNLGIVCGLHKRMPRQMIHGNWNLDVDL